MDRCPKETCLPGVRPIVRRWWRFLRQHITMCVDSVPLPWGENSPRHSIITGQTTTSSRSGSRPDVHFAAGTIGFARKINDPNERPYSRFDQATSQ
jgi:hypothetical protein